MSISDYIAIVGIAVGIIGIITGLIGWSSLTIVKEIRNTVSSPKDSLIQQAQTINVNGMDAYAVIKLSKETTQEELALIVSRLIEYENKLSSVEQSVKEMPKIHISKDKPLPQDGKDGDIWIQYKE